MSGVPEINSDYSSDYKKIHVAGIFGGTRAYGIEAILYSESMEVGKVLKTQPLSVNRMILKRTAECTLVIDPIQMKSIHKWLGEKITEYEKLFGSIRSPEEIGSKLNRDKDPTQ